jgi:hypothetical protein
MVQSEMDLENVEQYLCHNFGDRRHYLCSQTKMSQVFSNKKGTGNHTKVSFQSESVDHVHPSYHIIIISLHGIVTLLGFCRRCGVHYRLMSTCVRSFTCPGIDAQVQGTTVFSLIRQTLFVLTTYSSFCMCPGRDCTPSVLTTRPAGQDHHCDASPNTSPTRWGIILGLSYVNDVNSVAIPMTLRMPLRIWLLVQRAPEQLECISLLVPLSNPLVSYNPLGHLWF